jgi:hypothetical protein
MQHHTWQKCWGIIMNDIARRAPGTPEKDNMVKMFLLRNFFRKKNYQYILAG